ncbi:hypothetical protein [Mycobacterium sp.]|uniref:hypothetical protein n=1 Tax=Mycobacterium sp. TaxID=1785 RepID=UPI003C76864B
MEPYDLQRLPVKKLLEAENPMARGACVARSQSPGPAAAPSLELSARPDLPLRVARMTLVRLLVGRLAATPVEGH